MSSVTLFDERERQSNDFKRDDESEFSFLDRSDRPKVAEIRSTLNYWFSLLPEEKKNNFKSRLKAKPKHNFLGAFYELFLFQLFVRMGFDVVIEPKLEKSDKTPDFLLTKSKDTIFVEATTNEYSFTSDIPNFTIRQQVTSELDKLDLGDFRLLIYDLKVSVNQTPSMNALKKELLEHCKKIDLTKHSNHSILDSTDERFCYEDKILHFSTAFFIEKENKSQGKRTVFGDSFDFVIDRTIENINKSIGNKKSKYGKLNKPYIICVNFPYENVHEDQISLLMRSLDMHKQGIYCKSPGLSMLENIINHSVSAVLISFLTPCNIHAPQYWFIKNPQADFPIGTQLFMLDSYEHDKDNFVFKIAPTTISEVLRNP